MNVEMEKPGPLECPNCGNVWKHKSIINFMITHGKHDAFCDCGREYKCDTVWLMAMVKSIEEEKYEKARTT